MLSIRFLKLSTKNNPFPTLADKPISLALSGKRSKSWLTILEEGLLREQQDQNYNEYTAKLISTFQEQSGLPTTVEVDGATAKALNRLLRDLGAFDQPLIVKGEIRQEDGSLFVGAIVRAFDKDLRREQELGNLNNPARTDNNGRYEITYTCTQL